MSDMITHMGGCHCGRVRFEVRAAAAIRVSECNCSICAKAGYLSMVVPKERFTLLSSEDDLTTYAFNIGIAQHRFCSHCGIKSFTILRSHPDGINVNARCLDPGTVTEMTVTPSNGQEWEAQYPDGRAASYAN